ncbi:30392_t:CDS:2 [Gigaspora margarita]|uniref:30392_t:CDS:1 n=1 Tax=Gigaspora margarita TaxID=4874 RepID=A0ABN7WFS8_GIGMA|nr:30392_t:CDS:2 [Gigaspora margarita]
MELDKETFGLGCHYRNRDTNTNRLYCQNKSKIDMDEHKALIYHQRSTNDNKESEIIVNTESKGNAPGEEGNYDGLNNLKQCNKKGSIICDEMINTKCLPSKVLEKPMNIG